MNEMKYKIFKAASKNKGYLYAKEIKKILDNYLSDEIDMYQILREWEKDELIFTQRLEFKKCHGYSKEIPNEKINNITNIFIRDKALEELHQYEHSLKLEKQQYANDKIARTISIIGIIISFFALVISLLALIIQFKTIILLKFFL